LDHLLHFFGAEIGEHRGFVAQQKHVLGHLVSPFMG